MNGYREGDFKDVTGDGKSVVHFRWGSPQQTAGQYTDIRGILRNVSVEESGCTLFEENPVRLVECGEASIRAVKSPDVGQQLAVKMIPQSPRYMKSTARSRSRNKALCAGRNLKSRSKSAKRGGQPARVNSGEEWAIAFESIMCVFKAAAISLREEEELCRYRIAMSRMKNFEILSSKLDPYYRPPPDPHYMGSNISRRQKSRSPERRSISPTWYPPGKAIYGNKMHILGGPPQKSPRRRSASLRCSKSRSPKGLTQRPENVGDEGSQPTRPNSSNVRFRSQETSVPQRTNSPRNLRKKEEDSRRNSSYKETNPTKDLVANAGNPDRFYRLKRESPKERTLSEFMKIQGEDEVTRNNSRERVRDVRSRQPNRVRQLGFEESRKVEQRYLPQDFVEVGSHQVDKLASQSTIAGADEFRRIGNQSTPPQADYNRALASDFVDVCSSYAATAEDGRGWNKESIRAVWEKAQQKSECYQQQPQEQHEKPLRARDRRSRNLAANVR